MSLRLDEDTQQEEYEVECILAEKWQDAWDIEPFGAGTKYLTKWEGYPLWESTWEPAANFDEVSKNAKLPPGPTALELWNEKKAKISKANFANLCKTNVAKYEAARSSQQEFPPLEVALVDREAADSSQLNNLFMDSPTMDNAELLFRHPPKARKPPVVQPDSSSSEEELTDDPMMVELATTSKKTKCTSTGAEDSDTERRPTQKPAQSFRTSLKRAATTPTLNSATKLNLSNPAQRKEPRGPSLPQADSGSRNEQMKTVSAQRGMSDADGLTSVGSTSAIHNTVLPVSTSSGTAKRSVSFPTQTGPSNTTSGPGKSSGIRIVNQPKPQPRQTSALPKKSLFQTLHRQGLADKRSRREGTPDVAALKFVNAPPNVVVPNPQASRNDPYARREPSHRRIIAEEPQDDGPLRLESTDTNIPLEPWEINKVPQVCYQWRLSNNCRRSAIECRFMHRHKDENGRDYPVGDVQGRIPGKYRKPPLTCPFWLNGPKGCKKSAEECQFAHRNTGWTKHSDPAARDVQIDPDQRPTHNSVKSQLEDKRLRKALRPDQLTCWYWSKGKCRNSEQDCIFQHKDTGIIADGPHEAHKRSAPVSDMHDDMDIDDTVQPHMNDEVTRAPSPVPCEQPQQFEFQPPPPPPPPPPPIETEVKITCEELQATSGSVCKLDFEDMFTSNDDEKVVDLLESRAFLMYHPEDHFEELDIITRWLLLHHVQVASTSYQGAWAVFKQQILQGGSGIIIVHPDLEYFTAIPGFGEILRKKVRVWSVGLQPGPEYDSALTDVLPVPRHERIEIFPVGGFIYITEEVFETKPQLALEIVQLFVAKITNLRGLAGPLAPWQAVDDASLLWRLCVRPELMEFLYQKCEEHAIDLNAGNADMQSCAKLYTLLAETDYIEQDDPDVPPSAVADKYPILSERRFVAECEPVDYFNTVARSKEAANLNMIRYYAGLQVDLRRDYRHLFVVHTEPKAKYVQQWKQEIQTIADVITPEQCIQELTKDGQDSMFDFYERFMPEDSTGKVATEDSDATARVG